jgi:hypothetical protein
MGKDRSADRGGDEAGDPILLQKSHRILKLAPIFSPADDFADIELVSYMMANEIAQDIGPDIPGRAGFLRRSEIITMYQRLTRSLND